jgi:arylsulfatase A-like enzyme/Flp pilus assembly protein TadD
VPRSLLLCLLILASAACRRAPHAPPNVLLITLDTFRADRIGASTPALARLARDGVSFTNADSPVPLTLPAHASILSATLPLHHALHDNGAGSFPADRETLATLFARNGYRTGAFVSAFVLDHRFGLDRGFDVYDDEVARDATGNATSFDAERRGGDTVDRALAWLRRKDARPSFTWVHFYDAHAPYAPPAPYPQTYDGEVAYVDAQLSRLVAAVDRANTIIALVADHGEALGEHGELTHGLLLYEPTLHVPMIIAAPTLQARVVTTAVSTIDLAPAIASLAGLTFPKSDGRDALRDQSPRSIYAETEYPRTFGWSAMSSLREGAVKLIESPSAELFDLAVDPQEKVNLLTKRRRELSALSSRLQAMKATRVQLSAATVDEETKSKLASLGYVAPSPNRGSGSADPKSMAPLFRRFEEATALLNAGRTREAADALTQLVHADPANPAFRSTLARALRQNGQVGRAVDLLRQAVAAAPDDADGWYNLASALEESGNVDEAMLAIAEAAKRDPHRPEVHNVKGVLLAEQGKPAEAEREFRAAIEIDPRNARAFNNLGNVLRATGHDDDAAAAYRKAAELAPRYADPLNGLGAVFVQRGDGRAAIPYFDAALRIAPDLYEAELNRAIALQVAGDSAGSRDALRRLLARLPRRGAEAQRQAATALLARHEG